MFSVFTRSNLPPHSAAPYPHGIPLYTFAHTKDDENLKNARKTVRSLAELLKEQIEQKGPNAPEVRDLQQHLLKKLAEAEEENAKNDPEKT